MIPVSVIMPSLNVGHYVKECLESIVVQTMQNFEVICVDAGSDDGTLEIIHSFMETDARIRLLHSDVKSYGYQLNMGIDSATGEYIAIVEPDDIVPEDMLAALLRTAESHGADFVKAGFVCFGTFDGKKYFSNMTRKVPEDFWQIKVDLNRFPEIGLCDIDHIWTGLYKKKFLSEKRLRFNETPGASFQDTSFSILAGMLADTCVYMKDIVYMYRIDNEGSSVKSDAKISCVIDEFRYIRQVLTEAGRYTKTLERLLAHQKIAVYSWNCCRLSYRSAEKFLALIEDELQEMQVLIKDDTLKPYEVEQLKLLCSRESLQSQFQSKEEQKRKLDTVVDALNGTEDIVLVGAGAIAERILMTERMLTIHRIKIVADNDTRKQGMELMGQVIHPVESVAEKFPDSRYLIANRMHSRAIKEQLLRIGIGESRIVEVNSYPGLSDLLFYLKRS